MKFFRPMHPVVQNILIVLISGLVASVLCAKVYGATLPSAEAEKAEAPPPAVSAPQATAQTNPVLALIGAQGALPISANGLQITAPISR